VSGRVVETREPRLPFLFPSADATLGSVARLTRFLRNPKTIVAEVALLALLFVVSTIVPSVGEDGTAAPFARVSDALCFDHLFTSPLFLVVVALAMASLTVVLKDQLARAWRLRGGASRAAGPSGPRTGARSSFPARSPPEPLRRKSGSGEPWASGARPSSTSASY